MKPIFRITSIGLDEDQNVSGITAVASMATLAVVRDFLPDVSWTVLSEAENEFCMPVTELLSLFRACGGLNGFDPRHDHTYVIYDSLARVVYGLMEDE